MTASEISGIARGLLQSHRNECGCDQCLVCRCLIAGIVAVFEYRSVDCPETAIHIQDAIEVAAEVGR